MQLPPFRQTESHRSRGTRSSSQKRIVCAAADKAPLSKTNLIRVPQRRCALRDDEHRRLIRQCGKRAAQCLFGHIVERGSGVVQNENLGVTKCAGNGKALALSARKVAAFGGNLHIEPALTLYEVSWPAQPLRLPASLRRWHFFAPKRVFAQRAAKQDRALQYDVHLFAQFFKRIGITLRPSTRMVPEDAS